MSSSKSLPFNKIGAIESSPIKGYEFIHQNINGRDEREINKESIVNGLKIIEPSYNNSHIEYIQD